MPRSRRPILAPPDGVFPSTHAQRIGRRRHLRPGRARVRHHLQIERRLEFRAGRIPHAGRLCFAHHHDRREGPVCSGVCLDATLLGGAWPADGARCAAAAARAADHPGHHGYARPLQRAQGRRAGYLGHRYAALPGRVSHRSGDARAVAGLARISLEPGLCRGAPGAPQPLISQDPPGPGDARDGLLAAGGAVDGHLRAQYLRARLGDRRCRLRCWGNAAGRDARRRRRFARLLRVQGHSGGDSRRSRQHHRSHRRRPRDRRSREPLRRLSRSVGGRRRERRGAVRGAGADPDDQAARALRPCPRAEGLKMPRLALAVFLAVLFCLPPFLSSYWLDVLCRTGIAIIGAMGLNLLTGSTGQISLGNAAFLAVGGYATAALAGRFELPFFAVIPLAGIIAALIGMLFGIPSLRLRGLYLAMATLAAHFIVAFVATHWESVTGGVNGISVPEQKLAAIELDDDRKLFYLIYPLAVLLLLFARNLARTRPGRRSEEHTSE